MRNPWVLFAASALLALVTLVPRLSAPGLWEPAEMKVADQAVERAQRLVKSARDGIDGTFTPRQAPPECPKDAADDTGARELTPNVAAYGIDHIGNAPILRKLFDAEGAMRFYLALLALICALAAHGIAARLGTPRAGLFATIVLLSFPLTVLQARQLTSEIGTAAGAALIIYGMVCVARPARGILAAVDVTVAAMATSAGTVIAFLGGGALVGVLPPLAAMAVAGGLGIAILIATVRVAWQAGIRTLAMGWPRVAIGRRRLFGHVARLPAADAAISAVALFATVAAILVLVVLCLQVYDVQDMAPGTREILGKSFVPRECWSDMLGGVWRFHDDTRSTYDSMFEQSAFGMFPWSAFAPVALAGLALGHGGDDRRHAGRLLLAWATIAWIAGTLFQRKVGFTNYAGFPACAIAIGLWLDRYLDELFADDGIGPGKPHGLLVGLWVLYGTFAIGKDLQAFPDKLTSLLVGGDQIKFPPTAKLTREIMYVLSILMALAFALGSWLPAIAAPSRTSWRYHARRIAPWAVVASIAITGVFGIFWAQAWQPRLSRALSSKNVFASYRKLHRTGEKLGIMGDMGNAPRYYAQGPYETIAGREQLIQFLGSPERVFALAPANELCAIHRAFSGKPYYVLDDSNSRFMLLSNSDQGARDRNPLSTTILRTRPTDIGTEFLATYDDKIELIGYTIPRRVSLRSKFTMTLYFHVKKPISGSWKIFAHFDYKGQRFQGDHDPIRGRCATSFWQEGDYIVDTFEVEAGDLTNEAGNYQVLVGFFTGQNPNWKNMNVSQAPPGAKDKADRVLLGTIQVD